MNSISSKTLAVLAAVATTGLAVMAYADNTGQPGGPGEGGPMGDKGAGAMMMIMDFDKIDTNKDGKITPDEIAAFHKARATEADTNADGVISAEELVAFGEKMAAERKLQRAQTMIDRMDVNKDGKLQVDEMKAPADAGTKMFARIDTDGDGAISKAEVDAAKARFEEMRSKMRHGKHRGPMDQGDDEGDN